VVHSRLNYLLGTMHKFIVDMTIITELNTNTILPVDVIYIYIYMYVYFPKIYMVSILGI
jgi:hypothetical protein